MRVLISWHASVEPAYRRFFDVLHSRGVVLSVVAPYEWTEGGRLQRFSSAGLPYRARVLKTVFTDRIRAFFYPNAAAIAAEMSSFKPDIIHVMEEPFSLAAWQFLSLASVFSPSSRTVLYTAENLDIPQRFPFSFFQRTNLRRADAIAAVPEDSLPLWRGRGYNKQLVKISLGVDTVLFKRRPSASFKGVEPDGRGRFRVGYCGRLLEEKGVLTLIEAVGLLRDKGRACVLYILGGGGFKHALVKDASARSLAAEVKFIDPVTQEELPSFYSLMDVLVLPTVTRGLVKEQFGRVLVEAMACGTPVIGSSCGEIPGVIGDAGLIFPEGDATALSERIERLMLDEELRGVLAATGRERATREFSWDAVAAKYMALYEGLLRG